jgi:poly(3-hydroxybutyrate) depolymerase
VQAFLQDHEVYITEWTNARNVPVMEGRFDFHDYIDHIRQMLQVLGPRPHVVAVCQPGPPVLAAAALMAEDGDESRPGSMTFMGSPIDARLSPTVTNKLAEEKPFTWFQSHMIDTVPPPYPGMGRRVYPGFVQLASFMSMNIEKHQEAHQRYLRQLMEGDGDSAERHLEFYDEYLSVLDLTEEFYLQTVDVVFQRYLLPKGELEHRGRLVRPELITDIQLLTVEGENDDISGIGQTQAAHDLCSGLPAELKQDYVQPRVGHYGVFNGARFRDEIYPRVRSMIWETELALSRTAANGALPKRIKAA